MGFFICIEDSIRIATADEWPRVNTTTRTLNIARVTFCSGVTQTQSWPRLESRVIQALLIFFRWLPNLILCPEI